VTVATLQFVCPYCARTMQVPSKYVGQRGRCNRCGGRVLLQGDPNDAAPQSALPLETPASQGLPRIETLEMDALRTCWEALGPEGESAPRDAYSLRQALISLLEDGASEEGITGRTRSSLLRLGLDAHTVDAIHSESKAAAIHEELHLQPTVIQRRALNLIGATGAQIAAARTRAHARLLLEAQLLEIIEET